MIFGGVTEKGVILPESEKQRAPSTLLLRHLAGCLKTGGPLEKKQWFRVLGPSG